MRALEQMLEQTAPDASAATTRSATLSGGNQQRVNIAIGLLARPAGAAARRALLGPRPAPARAAVGVRAALWPASGTTVIFSTHYIQEAERYGDRLLVLADGERVFDGTQRELHEAVPESGARDFEEAFVFFLRDRGH